MYNSLGINFSYKLTIKNVIQINNNKSANIEKHLICEWRKTTSKIIENIIYGL